MGSSLRSYFAAGAFLLFTASLIFPAIHYLRKSPTEIFSASRFKKADVLVTLHGTGNAGLNNLVGRLVVNISSPYPGDLTLLLTTDTTADMPISTGKGEGRTNAFAGTTFIDTAESVDSFSFSGFGVVPRLSPETSLNVDLNAYSTTYNSLTLTVTTSGEDFTIHSADYYIDVSACALSPCNNGGSCVELGADQFSCVCPSGYGGTFCDSTFCASNPCNNGGTCNNALSTCSCPTGYTGSYCEHHSCSGSTCYNSGLSMSTNSLSLDLTLSGSSVTLGSNSSITLFTNLTHPWLEDLTITLKAPNAATAIVMNRRTEDSESSIAGTYWVDTNSIPIIAFTGSFSSTLKPEESFLSTFNGNTVNGDWTLSITDNYLAKSEGVIHSWGLEFADASCSCSNGGTCVGSKCFCQSQWGGSTCTSSQTTFEQHISSIVAYHWPFNFLNPATELKNSLNFNSVMNSQILFPRADYAANYGLFFDRADQIRTTAQFTPSDPFSCEIIFRLDHYLPSTATIFALYTDTAKTSLVMRITMNVDGTISVLDASTTLVQSTSVLALSTLTHLVFTYTSSTPQLYINGSLVATGSSALTLSISYAFVGGGFEGVIDEIALYNSVLSSTVVSNHYAWF